MSDPISLKMHFDVVSARHSAHALLHKSMHRFGTVFTTVSAGTELVGAVCSNLSHPS